MIVQKIGIQYSPNDLLRFMDSSFVSWMDRASEVDPALKKKYKKQESKLKERLFEEGRMKERYILKPFTKSNESIDILGKKEFNIEDFDKNLQKTRQAMMKGTKYILQAHLKKNNFFGVADLLERVDGVPSLLGDYYYIVKDAKMAQTPKASFVIQICAYCDLLESMQGIRPQTAGVLLGSMQEVVFNVEDYYQYYLNLKNNFVSFHNRFSLKNAPLPSLTDELWYWEEAAKEILKEKDDISLIANLEKEEIKALKQQGITTSSKLRETEQVELILPESWQRIKTQALIQHTQGQMEILPHSESDPKGLYQLPPYLEENIYCDLKLTPTIEGGEFIYLYNFYYFEEGGWKQETIDCPKSEWEKGYLARFLKKIHGLLKDKGKIIFFGDKVYQKLLEKSAEHSCYLAFVEKLFFTHRLVDLKHIIKQALVVNVPVYTFGEVAQALGFPSVLDDEEYALYIMKNSGMPENKVWAQEEFIKLTLMKMQALLFLHQKLLEIQSQNHISYKSFSLREDLFSEEDETQPLFLGENFNQEKYENASPEEKIGLLIKQLLRFHSHEEKPKKVETDLLLKQDLVQWRKHPRCLTHLTKLEILDADKRLVKYSFPLTEETKIKAGDSVILYKNRLMKARVVSLDETRGEIVLCFSNKSFETYSRFSQVSILEDNHLPTRKVDERNAIYKDLFDVTKPYCGLPKCLYDFLMRRYPDVSILPEGSALYEEGDNIIDKATQAIYNLNNSVLIMQGPPGAGKTYTSANIILNLIKEGKRIAISSNSHKAVDNLLFKLKEISPELQVGKIQDEETEEFLENDVIVINKDNIEERKNVQVVGGTVFGLMKPVGRFDYVFIDEAGQVGLSAIMAHALNSDNLVLIGDQMQLEQPIQAIHPGESGKSSLEYYLGDFKTIPNNRGFFLSETRRMNHELTEVVSKLFYEGKLLAHPSAHNRYVDFISKGIISKSKGVEFVSVEHSDNTQHSVEEVEKIKEIVDYLLGQRIIIDGKSKNITMSDMIFVSPYNMQVSKLKKAFPEARVGSVDLFQGQEAPIVIYSMASSTPGARGIEFLLNEHRINVALSRGQALAIVVASENLAKSSVGKLSELKLLNMFLKIKNSKY